jgi:hypothetical protein
MLPYKQPESLDIAVQYTGYKGLVICHQRVRQEIFPGCCRNLLKIKAGSFVKKTGTSATFQCLTDVSRTRKH